MNDAVEAVFSSAIHQDHQDVEDEINELNKNLRIYAKGLFYR